jgi:hypothetical protein
MELLINERQLKVILSQEVSEKEMEEQTDPSAAQPDSGTSSTQSGGQGYPEVGKWESGVTRGKANTIANNKWESGLTRGKANTLI